MRMWLEFAPDIAVLTVVTSGQRTEVRGQPGIGSDWQGSRLDRLIDAIPKRINISDLFAGVVVHVRPDCAQVIRDALAYEDALTQRLFASTIADRA